MSVTNETSVIDEQVAKAKTEVSAEVSAGPRVEVLTPGGPVGLPLPGDPVDVHPASGTGQGPVLSGRWVGLVEEDQCRGVALDGPVRVRVMVGGEVPEQDVQSAQWVRVVPVEVGLLFALAASAQSSSVQSSVQDRTPWVLLADAWRQADRREQAVADERAALVASAHEWADDNDLCSRFDDFCRDHGMPVRTSDYAVRATVSQEVTVIVQGMECAEDAERAVTKAMLLAQVTADELNYSVDYVEVD